MARIVGWLPVLAGLAACAPDMDAPEPWIPVGEIAGVLAPELGDTPSPRTAGASLELITFNVQFGTALPRLVDSLIMAGHDDADVLFVQEIESYPDEPGSRTRQLADALGMGYVYAPARQEGRGTHGIGIPMIAVHMTLCTVDTWLAQVAYARLVALDPNPQFAATIDTFLGLKERQLSFFEAQARYRLIESKQARHLTRKRLARTPWPIGAKAEPRDHTDDFYTRLFGNAPELILELDTRIDTLPGQSGLSLIRKAARL